MESMIVGTIQMKKNIAKPVLIDLNWYFETICIVTKITNAINVFDIRFCLYT